MDDERREPDYRKLIAWQRAMDLTMAVYDATEGHTDGRWGRATGHAPRLPPEPAA